MSTLKTNAIQSIAGKPILNSTGSIIQVQYSTSGFVNQSIASATPVALTGLSVNITPTSTSSAIIITATVVASYSYVCSLHVYRNGANLIASHGGNSQTGGDRCIWTHYQSSQEGDRENQLFCMPVMYRDFPNSTSTQTYAIHGNSGWAGAVQNTFRLNNRNTQDMLSSSYITVYEVTA
jgi:hypothetical protein